MGLEKYDEAGECDNYDEKEAGGTRVHSPLAFGDDSGGDETGEET